MAHAESQKRSHAKPQRMQIKMPEALAPEPQLFLQEFYSSVTGDSTKYCGLDDDCHNKHFFASLRLRARLLQILLRDP